MFKSAFANFTDSDLIVIGFILFIATFLGSFVWTMFVQKKNFYDVVAELPLKEGADYGIK